MSEDITIGGGTETILGSLAEAQGYVGLRFGDRYANWADADATDQKKTLVNAVTVLNALAWSDDADTFDERDALQDDNGKYIFREAQYELAVLIFEDSELTDEADQGSNVASLHAGSAGVDFFNATTKNADPLPPVVMRKVGAYLAVTASRGPVGGGGQAGSCENPFSNCSDSDRNEPW